ncbi:interferon-induced protein with tetratricopeptide repeats 5-like [Spea bombifrons]|uniref:interferon-induced protein with tetratricopeptide repeats 5-like n=1 Tax=Spea bombifrons TaxID=233779 RepID=UPI00234ACA75|nr:interferon-induced protein with tetratricopeptide repeats 5-like [Spea bombifrons]
MSSERALKVRLLQLNCHFTWQLLEKDFDADELEDRLNNQLEYLVSENKYMVYNMLAFVKHTQDSYTEAIANLEQAEKLCSDETNRKLLVTYGNFAWVYYYSKNYEKSEIYLDKVDRIYQELKKLSEEDLEVHEIYGEKGWSLLKVSGKYYGKAKECFEKALEADPDNPEWNSGYATAVYRLEGFTLTFDPSKCKSLELLKRAVELNPKDSVVKTLLGLKLQDLKRADEGLKYIEEALRQTPDLPYMLRYVAKFYRRAGMTDKALTVLTRAVALLPSSGFLHHQIGLCYRRKMIDAKKLAKHDSRNRSAHTKEIKDCIKKALFHFEMVVELKKQFVYAYIDLANMFKEANEYKKSEETFKKALTLANLSEDDKQRIHYYYGMFEEYGRKCESEAVKHYKEALLTAGTSENRQGCEQCLKRIANRRLDGDPKDAFGYGLLGFVYKIQQNPVDAIECYEKALNLDPSNDEFLSSLCELKLNI